MVVRLVFLKEEFWKEILGVGLRMVWVLWFLYFIDFDIVLLGGFLFLWCLFIVDMFVECRFSFFVRFGFFILYVNGVGLFGGGGGGEVLLSRVKVIFFFLFCV